MIKNKKPSSSAITHKHDKLFKKAMSDIRVAKEMIESYLPAEVLQHFNISTLRISKATYIDGQYAQSAADIVYSMKSKSNQQSYLYCLWEHQSKADPNMMLRFLNYSCRIMQHHKDQGNKFLPIVIPALVYNGKNTPYPFSCDLFEAFADKELARQLMFQPAHLIDLSIKDDSEILEHKWAAFMQMLLKHLRADDLLPKLELLQKHISYLSQFDGESILRSMLECMMLEGKISDQERFIEIVKKNSENTGEHIMTFAQELMHKGRQKGMQEGLQTGMQEGVKQGISQIVTNMMRKNINKHDIAELSGISIKEIELLLSKTQNDS